MKISLNLTVRLMGMVGLAYLGWYVGRSLSNPTPSELEVFATQLLMLAGAGLGLLITPRLTIEPLAELLQQARVVPLLDLFVIGGGVMVGLCFSVLLTIPLASLPQPFNQLLPSIITVVLGYIGGAVGSARRHDLGEVVKQLRLPARITLDKSAEVAVQRQFLIDTSAIIDGRITAVARTGFLDGTLVVPTFVLAELQQLADSTDALRRAKGRRGLELLSEMQRQSPLPIEVATFEGIEATRVDDKLIALAHRSHCPIITNDFNLNRVAALQGIKVLSLNMLSEAIRPLVMQDQQLQLIIRNEGNARQQGVGYLEDGTPVIVEDARHLIGKMVEVVVTRIHQTQTGRLIFAALVADISRGA